LGRENALPLVVRNLSFRYRNRPQYALRNVSFQAGAGEIILIAGASGSGKTTLMRCINGLIPRSYKGELAGEIRLFGQDPAPLSLPQISQMVGTVLQDPEKQIVGSYVRNEIAFGLENLGVPRPQMRARVQAILEYLGLAHLQDRETFHLSGGEKQKVAIAGVLAMEPSILLLDEPLANLDPVSMQETLALIRRLADEGRTVLIIEHRVEDVLKIAPDKVLFLVDGEQRYFGDVEGFEAVADPREVKLPARLAVQQLAANTPEVMVNGHEPAVNPSHPAKPGSPLVEFQDVTFWYEPEQPVLRDINFTIRRGDVIAILGPNGAGKTTLVKHAIGLLKPRRGRVLVDGQDTRTVSVAQVAQTLGYVFQSPSHMLFAPTVREELAFGPRNLGYDEATIARNVQTALEMVNLADRADDPPLALSFGQQKRVTIAAVLAMQSRILVMDEPTAGQDYRNYTAFMDALLHRNGHGPQSARPAGHTSQAVGGGAWSTAFDAVVFITHDLDLAISYANRVVLVNEGRIVADGPPHEVLADRALLARCRLVPTSLLELNLALLSRTGRFLRPELLARYVDDTDPGRASAADTEEKRGSV
jgi:energy-coupling factor transport system ATP-binding protein